MNQAIVLGGGIVGVSTALALQNRSISVTLIDRTCHVKETSFGNAGVITLGSIVPLNNPILLSQLPTLLKNRANGFRYSPSYAISQAHHLIPFLWNARRKSTFRRINALYQLITASKTLHRVWLSEADGLSHWRDNGWLQLYRTEKLFLTSQYLRSTLNKYAVSFDILSPTEITDLEPDINPTVHKGILINDASSVDNPGKVVDIYKAQFIDKGGKFLQCEALDAKYNEREEWSLMLSNHETLSTNNLIVALGPWSRTFLKKLGLQLPMFFERGSHREYIPAEGKQLHRPIFDVAGGFVATPMNAGIRITCGVELNQHNAAASSVQINIAESIAKRDFPITDQIGDTWNGSRPTVPDSLPVIGETKYKGLWLNTAHQHIGFATGPVSGEILAGLMSNQSTPVESPNQFSPSRFGL